MNRGRDGRRHRRASDHFQLVAALVVPLSACGSPEAVSEGSTGGQDTSGAANGEGGASDGGTGNGGGNLVVEQPGHEDKPAPDCERQKRFDAVTVGGPAPFDVIIIADHSESLSWSRDDLAAGLGNFLDHVRGHQARFFVLTPTQYGQTSEAARIPGGESAVVSWRDPTTGLGFENPMTRYENECWDGEQPITCPTTSEATTDSFWMQGTWHFAMPDPVAAITPVMDDDAIAEQRKAISNAILNLGLGGSSVEQPLCTLHRYMEQNTEPTADHAIFLLLADEDDTSLPADCLESYRVSSIVRESPARFLVQSRGPRSHATFQCTPVSDQGETIGTPVMHEWTEAGCTVDHPCNADELNQSLNACPTGSLVEDCQVTCYEGTTASCVLHESDTVTDACNSPFEYGGDSYADMLDYCTSTYPQIGTWEECTRYESQGSRAFGQSTKPLTAGVDASAMVVNFRKAADRAFGTDGYAVQLVGFDEGFSCEPQTGQSHLKNLKGLVDSEDDIFPICGDYAGALERAETFATGLVQTKYQLDLNDDEILSGVNIVSGDGSSRPLAEDEYTFDEASDMLEIQIGALDASDTEIELDILRACEVK